MSSNKSKLTMEPKGNPHSMWLIPDYVLTCMIEGWLIERHVIAFLFKAIGLNLQASLSCCIFCYALYMGEYFRNNWLKPFCLNKILVKGVLKVLLYSIFGYTPQQNEGPKKKDFVKPGFCFYAPFKWFMMLILNIKKHVWSILI